MTIYKINDWLTRTFAQPLIDRMPDQITKFHCAKFALFLYMTFGFIYCLYNTGGRMGLLIVGGIYWYTIGQVKKTDSRKFPGLVIKAQLFPIFVMVTNLICSSVELLAAIFGSSGHALYFYCGIFQDFSLDMVLLFLMCGHPEPKERKVNSRMAFGLS